MALKRRIICVMCWFIQGGVSICKCASVFLLWAIWCNNGLQRGRPSAGCTLTDDGASPSQIRQAAKYEVRIPVLLVCLIWITGPGVPVWFNSTDRWNLLWDIPLNPNQHRKRCQSHCECKHFSGLLMGSQPRGNWRCVQVTKVNLCNHVFILKLCDK